MNPYHRAPIMPVVSLPAAVEPFKWADRATQVVADVPLAKFTRLAADLVTTEGSVQVNCRFERNAQRIAFLRGDLATNVSLTCQRCLEPMNLSIQTTIDLALVHDEDEADKLPEDADYIVVAEQDVALAEIIEDELLLNVPYTPMHDHCESLQYKQVDVAAPVKENPFQVLAALKKPSTEE
ncbi:YceD family protein [Agitococcus lubricus]|uniref:Large ribosomal RNA subunit accumulation protein YceD n=1 Tax=Agitococcus lubricus TaxID=1077255 RepID=A0A2T5IZA7_9GAMM|nr:YceD family protein [Agitococcus lubricus]PTQ89377.1 uncharacterized protein C8N29_107110 [Agitococcus lubricus]